MPSLNELHDFVENQIGTFERGKWDYIGLAQLYPTLEVLGQLAPRKTPISNYEQTVMYQKRTTPTLRGAKPGDAVSPGQKQSAVKRKIKVVKLIDDIGWTKDQDTLQGKSDEHINRQIQMDLVQWDLHFWEGLENRVLQMPANIIPDDDEEMFGFPAWITDNSGQTDLFDLDGGDDPTWTGSGTGRPGGLSVADYPGFTNPVGVFNQVADDDFFKMFELFLLQRKLMGAVPNPRLLPDTPNDVCYVQVPLHVAITSYLTAGNENVGMDAGRYRGQPTYKNIPIVVWHALGHPDSPVRVATPRGYIIDWNSFEYGVVPEYDRKITGPEPINLVPSSQYVVAEHWHQLNCLRPDRNLFFRSSNTAFNP